MVSEQSLPTQEEFVVVGPDGSSVSAKMGARDPGTNIAVLRPVQQPWSPPVIVAGAAKAGELALAYGADGEGGVTARMGVVNLTGPQQQLGHKSVKTTEIYLRARAGEKVTPTK